MDRHISEYYSVFSDETPSGNFHEVIPLHENRDVSWKELQEKIPTFCRGWYELGSLTSTDRVEFLRDYWMTKLPFHPHLPGYLDRFFESLDDIGVFIIQSAVDEPCLGELVYSLGEGGGFYRGALPATLDDITRLKNEFVDYILPEDYLNFLQIHNGFCKATDVTGLTPIKQMKEKYLNFQEALLEKEPLRTTAGRLVEPKSLIPFYESFGLPFFQCFYAEWYPEQEMGNVYFSATDNSVSDYLKDPVGSESMAFSTFLDWLFFYLEKID